MCPARRAQHHEDLRGTKYTFAGSIGIAPQWETGTCGTDCQEFISACMLAHVNTSGLHIALWLDSDAPSIGWGRSTDYPYQEGAFFGNIFASPAQAYYCNGKDFDLGTVPGRLGVATMGSPCVNPFASTGSYCLGSSTAPASPYQNDGYQSCKGFKHVITVRRNFDPTISYKVCNRATSKCLDVQNGSMASAAPDRAEHDIGRGQPAVANHPDLTGKYNFVNVNSGQALDISGAAPTDGTLVVQNTYSGVSKQLWAFTPTGDGFYRISPGGTTSESLNLKNGTTSDGATIEIWAWGGWDSQNWSVLPVGTLATSK